MMCHFGICTDISGTRSQGVDHKVWATNLFKNLNESLGSIAGHKTVDKDEIERHIAKTGDVSYTADSDEGGFRASTVFKSFHYHAGFPVSS